HPAIQDIYTVTVAVDDGVNLPASTSFDWVINDVNQAPVAVNDGPFTVIHDTSLVLDVLANDSDADGDTLTVVAITNHPANGMVTINADFTLTYTPDAGFVGDDPFTYTIDDGFGGSDEATVVVSVTNQAPEAVDDVYGTDQVTTLNIPAPGVLGNDSDADGDSLTSILSSNVSNGALTLNADGSFSYVPGSIGPDSFTYVANDGISDSNIATVAINVSEINLPPDVSNPGAQTNAETDLINLAVVASDPNGDTLSYSATGLPTGLSIDPASGVINGSVAYEAVGHPDLAVIYPVTVNVSDGDLVSSVSFDWTVDDVNQLPIAIDDGATTDPNTPVTVIVLSNDNDADNDTLAVSNITIMPLNGTVQINNDDSITYTPNTGFVSTDNFTYEVEDGFGGTATATVTISVVNIAPVAVDDTYSTEQDVELVVPAPGVLGNDSDADGDTLTAAPTSIAANGVVTLNDNGSFLYVPNAGYTGPDSFTYVANDGFVDSNEATVNINVTQGNLLPVADAGGPYEGTAGVELTFDGTGSNDPDGTIVSYLWTFGDGGTGTGPTPTHTYANAEIYTVTLEVTDDSGATDTAATVATIAPPPNVVPVAVDDSYSMLQDSALNILAPGVLGNDSDADGDPLTAALDSGPSNGAVNLNADGSFDYTPDAGFSGTDSFTYVASDGEDNSNIATVTISVDTVNYAPNVGSVADQSDAEESTVSLAVIADDPNGDALTYSATGLPPNLTINAGSGVISGVISLDAVNHPDLSASYAVTVTVSDGVLSSAVSFNWNVTDVNQDPVAVDDSASTTMDTAVTIDVLANDSDADGDALMVSGVGTAANGTAVNNGDGTVTYTPNTGFSGADSFTYTIEDGFGLAASATVTITVTDIIGDADVYLSSMRVPSILKLREDRETTRRINVFGDGVSIEQDATVTLSVAGHPGIEVEIDPASVISSVIPGGGDTRFTFSAEIECEEAGSYVLEWTAVINAAENEDPTNDTLTQSTAVECKASTSRRER
ncbi:MAG: Ig-like domain-containing protein, partial [Pseudomonadota bacterium]